MFRRELCVELQSLAKQYPVVTVLGPRQSGKTTLVKEAFPKKMYINLEDPDIRQLAESDPRQFLSTYKEGAIIDEIQRLPILLSYIQVIVDEQHLTGLFVVTGSHQFDLQMAVSQSLAGRTALLVLLPMSLQELSNSHLAGSLDEMLLKGGYPRIYKDNLDPTKAYRNYFQTYVERDLRQLIHIKDLAQFEKFVRLCAGRVGQPINHEGLGNEVGISSPTAKQWLSLLEHSFIIFRLQPYFENFGKRIIKSPKLYFTDVGLATYLLGIENCEQLSRDPLRGALVENLVVLELVKARFNQGKDSQLYYYRDVQKHEVDLIFKKGNQLIPIEIKSGQTYHTEFLKGLRYFHSLVGDRAPQSYLIYTGSYEGVVQTTKIVNYWHSNTCVS